MIDLTNNAVFKKVLGINLVIAILLFWIVLYVLKKNKVNVNSSKVMSCVLLPTFSIVLLPFWLHPSMTIMFKLYITALGTIVGLATFFAPTAFRENDGNKQEHDSGSKQEKSEKENT